MQIGKAGQERRQQRHRELRAGGQDLRRPEGQRGLRRRRLRQQARRGDRRGHRQVQAVLGRLRQQAGRHRTSAATIPTRRPRSSSAIRCTAPSSRTTAWSTSATAPNDRIQVFQKDGTFVKEAFIAKKTLGDGSVWDIAFSKDPQQKYLYLADGKNEKVYVMERETLRDPDQLRRRRPPAGPVLRRAQHRHRLEGQHLHDRDLRRASALQKFVYKGLRAVPKRDQGTPWPGASD